MPNTRGLTLRTALLVLAIASPATAQTDTVFAWSKKLPDGARFAIRNLNGGIEVRPGTTDQVEVRAIIRGETPARVGSVAFDVREHTASDVEICTTERGLSACVHEDTWSDRHIHVRYIVDLPKGLRFRGTTGNGSVIVMQSAVEVDATTANGDVVVRESLSRVLATSGSGDVTVALANGPVRATSGNGDVMVNTALGPVTATSGNGDVDVRMISVAEVSAPETMTVSSGNGAVRLTLPADFSGQLDASTGNGEVKSDFSVRSQARDSKSRLRGSIGSGGELVIRIHSGNGRVEVRKD